MDIVSGVVPVPCGTPVGYRQHADLLVIANSLSRYSCSASELTNRQWSLHGRSPLPLRGRRAPSLTGALRYAVPLHRKVHVPLAGRSRGRNKKIIALDCFFISTILESWKLKTHSPHSPPWRTKPG